MLNESMDEVLLVKGWKKSGTWSFPRGKINKGEDDLDCAIREAWEETGFDLRRAGLVKDPKKIKHIEKTMRAQNMKLFVFRGVPRDASFVPQTRKEISKIEWFKLADLPTEKRKAPQEGSGQHLVLNANKFYVVAPFVNDLKKIINAERRKDQRQSSRAAAASATLVPETYIPDLPMSPAIPSSLPEVTVAPSHTLPNIQTQPDTMAKSNALLALLRRGPSEAKTEIPAPQEYIHFSDAPQSPEQFTRPHPNLNLQSPQPTFDFHQQVHPAAPPSSALPQLSQHTRSLLDTFTQPAMQSPPARQIPLAKQSLLAAFGASPSVPAASPQPTPSNVDQGSNLLRLLQRTPEVARAVPQQMALANNQPSAQQTPFVNPLMSLLKTQPPAEQSQPTVQAPSPAPTQTQLQPQPIELSATPSAQKAQPAARSKDALLSLLKAPPKTEAPKNISTKTKSGTTSATLDQPVDHPQLDAISRVPTLKEDIARPVASEKKLFDHKTGSVRPVPPKPIVVEKPKLDDKIKAQKSPRHGRQKQVNSPNRRPVTPKEAPKPFQPQILKRSQLAEDDLSSILPLRPKEEQTEEASSPEPSPAKLAASGVSMPLFMDSVPISPTLNAPHPVSIEDEPTFRPGPYSPQSSKPIAAPVPDPQRDALLALLRTPVKSPSPISTIPDLDATPKAPASVLQPQISIDDVISPPPASQVISPVQEAEPPESLPRSRVSSLASAGNGWVGTKPVIEKRQTAANEKAFLLSYLKGLSTQDTTM